MNKDIKAEQLYNKKIISSGDRLEVYKYNSYQVTGRESRNETGRAGKEDIDEDTKAQNKVKSRKEVLYKARNNIIRLVKSNADLSTFITLTYQDNYKDLGKSKEHLKLFFKKLKKDYTTLKFLYVLEYQQRGAIHYHILCNVPINIKLSTSKEIKSIDHRALENSFKNKYWSNRGFVDIRNLESEDNTNIALYVSVYLVEDLMGLDLQGNRCYGYSRNLNKPLEVRIDSKDSVEDIIKELDSYKLTHTNSYEIGYRNKKGMYRNSSVTYLDFNKNKGELI